MFIRNIKAAQENYIKYFLSSLNRCVVDNNREDQTPKTKKGITNENITGNN